MNYKELKEKLERCKNQKLEDIDPNEVDEISDIKVDKRKSSNERILDFLNTTKNPYVFKVKGRLVKIGFADNGKTADDCLTNVLRSLYK